ncbi:hypothetical protein COLO4_12055 [Corchorus olitorius]|uniref:PORR domain-containing protein n=1 Tax=Corchorus olitorius TaxID=93759 RepID=A0A1R3K2B5_9ROSI|nr:hypothetical protein COLO4_12055 [Corchorus olitorius]
MAWRFFFLAKPLLNTNPKFPNPRSFSTSFLITKIPKKHKPKRPKPDSPRTRPVTPESNRIPHFESLLDRDATFRFLMKTKEHLSKQPEQVLLLDEAGKLHRELGFPRGRKVARSISRHPLLFTTYRHSDNKMWLGFTDLMDQLLLEEKSIMEAMEEDRVTKVLEDDGKQVLELIKWDPSLAVSALEREFLVNEDKVKKAFKFPVTYSKDLGLEENDVKKLNLLNTLPLVSPYSDGWKLDLWSLEAEKYRVGIIHEFLSLTLEKRALIHHIVEFKEEFSLTRQTYEMLKGQPRTFYLAGTEMNWAVFLKDGYDENGNLIDKDPQVVFNEKLFKFAQMQGEDLSSGFEEKISRD